MSRAPAASTLLARKIAGFWAFSGLTALVGLAWLLSIPSEHYAGMPFGLSPIRLGLAGAFAAAGGFSALLAGLLWRKNSAAARITARIASARRWLAYGSIVLFLPALLISLLPVSQVEGYAATLTRARPVLVYLAAVSGVAAFALAAWRFGWQPRGLRHALRSDRAMLRLTLGLLLAGLALVAFSFLSGFGVTPDNQGWNNPSVGISSLQMLAVVLALLGIGLAAGPRLVKDTPPQWQRIDTLLELGAWLAAAILWNVVSLPTGFFAPGPFPPDYQYHPFSDSVQFDVGGQYLLMGEGILRRQFTDRPVYMAFLALLRALAGQGYNATITLQVIVFAIFPAGLYALGRRLHGRAAGVLLAGLFIIQEMNAIEATRWLSVSHVRWMMTEFPATLLMSLALLAFMLAFSRQPNWPYLALSGLLLAAAAMVRANPLFVLAACLVYWLLTQIKTPRRALLGVLTLLLAFSIGITPWSVRTTLRNNVTVFFAPKLENVVKQRFLRQRPVILPGSNAIAAPTVVPKTPIPTAVTLGTPTPAPTAAAAAVPAQSGGSGIAAYARAAVKHTLHTALSALYVLPGQPKMAFPSTALREFPYTSTGLVSPPAGTFLNLTVHLAVICLGIALAWRRLRWAGLAPLVVFLAICLSNGAARSSGGRYQVSADWIVLVYFAVGLAQIGLWLLAVYAARPPAEPREQDTAPAAMRPVAALLALVILLCAAPPLAELVIPRREVRTAEQAIRQISEISALLPAPVENIEAFMQTEGAIVRYGRLLYPRFFYHDAAEPSAATHYRVRPYPRLVFELLSNTYKSVGVLPASRMPDVTSGSTALIIGCQDTSGMQIHTLIVLSPGEPRAYTRDPLAPLQCPIREPLCDNNHNCW